MPVQPILPTRRLMTVTSKDGQRSAVMENTEATFRQVFHGRFPMASGGDEARAMTAAEGLDWLYVERVRNRLEGISRGAAELVPPSPRAERMAKLMKASLYLASAA